VVLAVELRAARHAALGDPVRLAIIDELAGADRAPVELRRRFGLESNLLAHHLDVLETAGLLTRHRSSGDGRRRYLRLERAALDGLVPGHTIAPGPALFVCTHNSARSQLAAALWTYATGQRAESAGTAPAKRVHPGAVAAARRAGLRLGSEGPRRLVDVRNRPAVVVTVCDRAHEELDPPADWLHWSITDPVPDGTAAAFDAACDELRSRVTALCGRSS
jgi:protein-tyrosine-phosphatase